MSRCRPRNNRGDVGTETETFLTGPFLVARSRRVIYSREKSFFNSRDSSAFDGTPRVPSFMAELRRVARKAIGQKFVSLARTTKNDFSPENCTRKSPTRTRCECERRAKGRSTTFLKVRTKFRVRADI